MSPLKGGLRRKLPKELPIDSASNAPSSSAALLQSSGNYSCRFTSCNATFIQMIHLMEHDRTHTEIKPYRCRFEACNFESSWEAFVLIHIRMDHFKASTSHRDPREFLEVRHDLLEQEKAEFKKINQQQPTTSSARTSTRRISYVPTDSDYSLPSSDESESSDESASDYDSSIESPRRSKATRQRNSGRKYPCRFSGCNTSFYQLMHLKEHDRTHTKIKPYRCTFESCNYESSYHRNMVHHIRVIHFNLPQTKHEQEQSGIVDKRDPKQYIETLQRLLDAEDVLIERTLQSTSSKQQETNGNSSDNSEADQRPPRTSTSSKPPRTWKYTCRYSSCEASFDCAMHLKHHERVHSGLKPFRCTFEACTFEAAQQSNVTFHIRTVHFNLPKTQREQAALGIVDDRDPREFIEVRNDLLELEEANFDEAFPPSSTKVPKTQTSDIKTSKSTSVNDDDDDESSDSEYSESESEQPPTTNQRLSTASYRCLKCHSIIKSKQNAIRHVRSQHFYLSPDDRRYMTNTDDNALDYIRMLDNREKAKGQQSSDDSDDSDDTSESTISNHRNTSTTGHRRKNAARLLTCRYENCNQKLSAPSYLKHHERTHSGLKPYRCRFEEGCTYEGAELGYVKDHIRVMHFNLPRTRREQNELGIIEHRDPKQYVEIRHDLLEREDAEFELSFPTKSTWRRLHKEISTLQAANDALLQQPSPKMPCNRSTTIRRISSGHLTCPYDNCGTTCHTLRHLKMHSRVHTGRLPYKCTFGECTHAAAQCGNLELHILRQHFKVSDTSCSRAEMRKEDSRDPYDYIEVSNQMLNEEDAEFERITIEEAADESGHAKDESGQKMIIKSIRRSRQTPQHQYICRFCRKSCRNLKRLKQHDRTHTGLKPYRCNYQPGICFYESTTKHGVLSHIRTIHFGLPRTLREQDELGIADNRDPRLYIEESREMLAYEITEIQNSLPFTLAIRGAFRQSPTVPLVEDDGQLEEAEAELDDPPPENTSAVQLLCRWDNCTQLFWNLDVLRAHDRTHSGILPFRCRYIEFCEYEAASKNAIIRHIRRKHLNFQPTDENLEDYVKMKLTLLACEYRLIRSYLITNGVPADDLPECEEIPVNCSDSISSDEDDDDDDLEEADLPDLPNRGYVCRVPECTVISTTINKMKEHDRTHTGVKPFRCTFGGCNLVSTRRFNVIRHVRNVHFNLSTTLSGQEEANPEDYLEELEEVLDTEDREIRGFLKKKAIVRTTTKQSTESMYINEEGSFQSNSTAGFTCRFAPCKKWFSSLANCLTHEKTHSGIKPFRCMFAPSTCQKTFSTKGNLMQHIRGHHLNIPVTLQEQEYRRIRDDRDPEQFVGVVDELLEEHELLVERWRRSHALKSNNNSDYKQALLPSTSKETVAEFKRLGLQSTSDSSLSSSETKTAPSPVRPSTVPPTPSKGPFICPINFCNAAFPSMTGLKRHYRTHTGLKPYRCRFEACDFTTFSKGTLTVHIRMVHFKLPKAVYHQEALGIVDDRDPAVYIEVMQELLDEEDEELARLMPATSSSAAFRSNLESELESEDSISSDEAEAEQSLEETSTTKFKATTTTPSNSSGGYVCLFDYCGKTFHSVSYLKDHDRIHRNIRPFRCKYSSSCTYDATAKCNALAHIRTVHLNLPHTIREQEERGIEDDRDPEMYLETDQKLLDDQEEMFLSLDIYKRRPRKSKRHSSKRASSSDSDFELTDLNRLFNCRMCNTKIMGRFPAIRHVRSVHFKVPRNLQIGLGLEGDNAINYIVAWNGDETPKEDNNEDSEVELDNIVFDYDYLSDGEDGEVKGEEEVEEEGNVELEVNQNEKDQSAVEVAYHYNESDTSDYSSDTSEEDDPKLFRCTKASCDASFRTAEEIIAHRRIHPNRLPFKCIFNEASCSFASHDKSKTIRHIRLIHFQLPTKVREQVKLGLKDICDAEKCIKTRKRFLDIENEDPTPASLDEKKKKYPKGIQCSYIGCKKRFHNDRLLVEHQRLHDNKPYKCKWTDCSYSTVQKAKLLRHIRGRHFNMTYQEMEGMQPEDDQAGDYVEELTHLMAAATLAHHQRQRPEVPTEYPCSFVAFGQCTYYFTSRKALQRHERYHLCIASFHCNWDAKDCDYRHDKWGKVFKHIRGVHLGLPRTTVDGDADKECRENIRVVEELLDY